jgi:hypothetical protein
MTLFAIIRPPGAINNSALEAAIAKKYPRDFYKLTRGQWLIWADETTRTLSKDLGIEVGKHFGSTLVLQIEDYFGLHSSKVWDWIKERRSPSSK